MSEEKPTTDAPEYVFKLRYVSRPDDAYYITRWDRAKEIEVVARSKPEALNKAEAALGDPGRGDHWVYQTLSIRDFRLRDEAT